MENKINIAELLKDCPKGMELDSTMLEGLEFDDIIDNEYLPIRCRVKNPDGGYNVYNFTKYGCWLDTTFAKCVIFPKGKTTWEGFQRPFKDGDILSYQYEGFINRTIYIYMQHNRMNTTYYVALSGDLDSDFMINDKEGCALNGYNDSVRFATEKEKQQLFAAIKDNGYEWNPETKTLEKLPKFKVRDRIKYINGKNKDGVKEGIILSITNDTYDVAVTNDMGIFVPISEQDNWELVPNKFDITTLKPFESRVLVRDRDNDEWRGQFFSHYNNCSDRPYICIGNEGLAEYKQCIPYEGNEHLLGTTDVSNEYYKTW